jgi:hypothetical protein
MLGDAEVRLGCPNDRHEALGLAALGAVDDA